MVEAQNLGDVQGDIHGIDDVAPHGVVDVVIDVGYLVRNAHDLPLQCKRVTAGFVVQYAVHGLPCEVQPLSKEAMKDLRMFMFEHVYLNPLAKSEEEKAIDMIKNLYGHRPKYEFPFF